MKVCSREFYLDANNDAFIFDDLRKKYSLVRLLVQRFVEEDNPTHTLGDGWVDREEEIAEVAAVLFIVLHIDLLQTLAHGT